MSVELKKSHTSSSESSIKQYDEALRFITEKKSLDEQIKVEQRTMDAKLMRKIDWCLLPMLGAIYFLEFLDKIVFNYAGVMGIKENLKGDDSQI